MSLGKALQTVSEPVNKLVDPLAESIGNTVKDLWDLVFGSFGVYVEKKRLLQAKALSDFKESLEEKIAAIPPEQLREPKLSVIGPTLEASKFYFEEPELREMFANLIAASMNSEKLSAVHPSFSNIIQQMSPLDAQNLALFDQGLPIAEYRLENSDGTYKILFRNVFLANPSVQDLNLQAQSLSSLSRLGLITISFSQREAQDSAYVSFENTPFYLELKLRYPKTSEKTVSIQKGATFLTPLGIQFRSICLPA